MSATTTSTAKVYQAPGHAGSPVTVQPRYQNFIGGHWVPPVHGEYMQDLSPATAEPFTEVPRSTREDIELALDAAHAARQDWGETSLAARAKVLNRIADVIEDHTEMLAVAESWDNGKPVRETLAADIPLAVLVNGGSASDSEIVAGALHDAHRALLIGDTTLGTGTVLTQFQLPDGSALLLAVQEWLTPNKVSFWHRGIAPDVKVNLAPQAIPLRPAAEREMTAEQLRLSGDAPLLKAIELLSRPSAKP